MKWLLVMLDFVCFWPRANALAVLGTWNCCLCIFLNNPSKSLKSSQNFKHQQCLTSKIPKIKIPKIENFKIENSKNGKFQKLKIPKIENSKNWKFQKLKFQELKIPRNSYQIPCSRSWIFQILFHWISISKYNSLFHTLL